MPDPTGVRRIRSDSRVVNQLQDAVSDVAVQMADLAERPMGIPRHPITEDTNALFGEALLVDPLSGPVTITLPLAAPEHRGKVVTVAHDSDSDNSVTVAVSDEQEVISGASSVVLSAREVAMFSCTGPGWYVFRVTAGGGSVGTQPFWFDEQRMLGAEIATTQISVPDGGVGPHKIFEKDFNFPVDGEYELQVSLGGYTQWVSTSNSMRFDLYVDEGLPTELTLPGGALWTVPCNDNSYHHPSYTDKLTIAAGTRQVRLYVTDLGGGNSRFRIGGNANSGQQASYTSVAAILLGGSGLITEGWDTVLDLDFSAEPNQTLSPDGNYTIGGLSWTKFNSAADSVAMAIVNGSGLVQQPAAATDHYTTVRSLPGISIPLTSLISTLDPGTRFRFWVYIPVGNWAANYDFTDVWIENPATNTWQALRKNWWSPTAGALAAIHMYNGADQGAIYNTNITSDVLRLDLIGGLGSLQASWAHGAWSSGWPTPNSLIPYAYREAGGTMHNLYAGATPIINAPTSWNLCIGSARAGSGTALSVTIARLKVEVKR
jgi:hypothetical protein